MLKKAIVSVAALSLMATPVLAANGPAVAPQRAAATADETSDLRGRRVGLVPILVGVGVILLILYLTDTWPFDDDPDSP